ncbi:MAG: methylmalonyl-CoA mutase family protein [Calditrichia bacterium]
MDNQPKEIKQSPLNIVDDFPPPTYREWRSAVEELLKGADFEKTMFTTTPEDIVLQPMYRQDDVADLDHLHSLPGFPPYIRGTRTAGFLTRSWQIAQRIPYPTPREFNRALINDLQRGQTAIQVVLDKASRAGQDADQSEPQWVGHSGLSLSTLEDLETALKGVDLRTHPIFIHAGASGLVMAGFLAALCKKRRIDLSEISGGIGWDPLGELLREGQIPYSLEHCYHQMAILGQWTVLNAPKLHSILVDAGIYAEAGGSAVEELAFGMATGCEYMREMLKRNLRIDQIAPRFRFTFALGSNFFMEIAKLRAARLLWQQIVVAFGGNSESQKIFIHGRTGRWNKTVYDPYVNMLRVTTEALAGIIGGCDSLEVSPFDELLRLPDEFSRRIARNTPIILRDESHLDKVIDPAGGSWYIEKLTAEIAEKSWKLFQQIEAAGGMRSALQDGIPQQTIEQTAAGKWVKIAKREAKLIGTTLYANPTEEAPEIQAIDPQVLFQKRSRYLQRFRTGQIPRDGEPLKKIATALKTAGGKVVEAIADAALSKATLSEISQTIFAEQGTSPRIRPLTFRRAAEDFERLRLAMEAYKKREGEPLKVFLANMGEPGQYRARADFVSDFFHIAGFQVIASKGFSQPSDAARAALQSGATVVVICSDDKSYPRVVPQLVPAIKQQHPQTLVLLAGYPREQIEEHQKAGLDDFIHLKINAYQMLNALMEKLGVLK